MKNKTKIVSLLLASIIAFSTFILSGCDRTTDAERLEENAFYDGAFRYYYIEDEDCYAIVGDKEEENPTTMYVPSHYNGKEIKYLYYSAQHSLAGQPERYGLTLKNVEKVYFPYNSFGDTANGKGSAFQNNPRGYFPKVVFFANCYTQSLYTNYFIQSAEKERLEKETYYMITSSILYESLKNYYLSYSNIFDCKLQTESISEFAFKDKFEFVFRIANISFMFNYDDCPNEGYFFINEFTRGGQITAPPYEPIREGYKFDGWYKESECINKWDFHVDTLPVAQYDEDGYVVDFIETKLYAKWIKG